MKTAPQMQKLLVLSIGTALAITALTAYSGDKPKGGKGGNHGTDIIHLSVKVQMDNGGIVTNASGQARIDWQQQGNANHQDLIVNVRGLDAETSYDLEALVNDDTNLTSVVSFTTDAEGNASIDLEDKGHNDNGHGHGHGHAYGHNKHGHMNDTLPAALEPVGHIHQLVVLDDTGTNVVLTADFTTANCFQYLVKRNISSDSVNAELRIIANRGNAQVRLSASGLAAGDYTLLLNDTAAETQTADDHGRVDIRSQLANPSDILSVSSVSLVDAGTNVVVSTTLP
jgi:hypothetical protein